MINGLVNSRAVYTPPGCPAEPFNPASLNLSLWMQGRDNPGATIDFPSRASAGSSASQVGVEFFSGPQSSSKPAAGTACGLDLSSFSPTGGGGGLRVPNIPGSELIAPTAGTVVAIFRYYESPNPFGAAGGSATDAAVVGNYYRNWGVRMSSGGNAVISGSTSIGGQFAGTANSVSSGDWALVTGVFDSGSMHVTLNRGTAATVAYALTVSGSAGDPYVGIDVTFSNIVRMHLGQVFVSPDILSAGNIASLQAHCEWYIGATV